MLLVAEKRLANVKVLAITCVDGNTTMDNVIKNTYRILYGLNRTDVRTINTTYLSLMIYFAFGKNMVCSLDWKRITPVSFGDFRYRYIKV